MPRASGWLLVHFSSALACGAVVDFPGDPQLVDDGPWRCLGQQAPSESAGAATATVRVRPCDAFGDCSAPLGGLSAQLCSRVDVGCTQPLLSGIVDVDGVLQFEVPLGREGGFEGYLAVSSESELCTSASFGEASAILCAMNPSCNPELPDDSCRVPAYVRSLLFFNPPIIADTVEPLRLTMLSSAAQPALAGATGGRFDPTKGSLVVTGFDCDGAPASGLRYDVHQNDGTVSQWYFANGILTANVSETDVSGLGGFLGLPPGFVAVEAYNSDEQRVGEVGLQVSAGSISYASLVPSP